MIRNRIIYFLSVLVIMTSCVTENENNVDAIDTTKRVFPSLAPTVPDSEYAIVKSLFSKYHVSLSNLKVFRFSRTPNYNIRCYQYYFDSCYKDFAYEIFTNDLVFSFYEDVNYFRISGVPVDKIQINLFPKVSIAEASNLFYNELKKDWWYKDSLVSYSREGFGAELGIYDLNTGFSNLQHNYVLAWRLTVNNGFKYPRGYIRADKLELINYSNGIIIN